MTENTEFEQLRNAIEAAVDRKMRSPRDFDFLAAAIYEKLHQGVSSSTLKRCWGYLPQPTSIRLSTLNLLAQFVDYKDWEDFCLAQTSAPDTADISPNTPTEPAPLNRPTTDKRFCPPRHGGG